QFDGPALGEFGALLMHRSFVGSHSHSEGLPFLRMTDFLSLTSAAERIPPLPTNCSPVSHPESSDARKTATGAMSPTCPLRANGTCETIDFSKSEPMKPALTVPSVSTIPGFNVLTRIFLDPSSLESTPVIASTAPLV